VYGNARGTKDEQYNYYELYVGLHAIKREDEGGISELTESEVNTKDAK
jgi:hypothetical protein